MLRYLLVLSFMIFNLAETVAEERDYAVVYNSSPLQVHVVYYYERTLFEKLFLDTPNSGVSLEHQECVKIPKKERMKYIALGVLSDWGFFESFCRGARCGGIEEDLEVFLTSQGNLRARPLRMSERNIQSLDCYRRILFDEERLKNEKRE